MEKEKEKRVEGGTLNRGCISIYIGRAQSGKEGWFTGFAFDGSWFQKDKVESVSTCM